MRNILTILFILTLAGAHAQPPTPAQTKRELPSKPPKRIGLVLSGGGAKGVAHIGVLKVLERAGVPVDVITGTSMGSIIGGLYACGNDATHLDSIVRAQDWTEVLSDKDDLSYQSLRERERHNTYILSTSLTFSKNKQSLEGGIIMGKNIRKLFTELTYPYTDSISFNDLPIPFACVATDMVSNSEYVFHSGILGRAMRASMAIPGAFSPVRKDDMVLVDGGLKNNYPADVAKEMGADFIIGSTVQDKGKTKEQLRSTMSILLQLIDMNVVNKLEENLAITNIPIWVNVEGYSAASFNTAAIDSLIHRGEMAAMEHWDELVALGQLMRGQRPHAGRARQLRMRIDSEMLNHSSMPAIKIGELKFEHMTHSDEQFIRTKFRIKEGDSIDSKRADLITTSIRLDLFYKDAEYRIVRNVVPQADGTKAARLVFIAGDRKSNQIGLGVRFDIEELVALQTYAAFPIRSKIPMEMNLTLRLGKRIMAKADWSLHPTSFMHPTISYTFRRNDINFYEFGNRSYNLTYNRQQVKIAPFNFTVRNFDISIGAAWDHYFNFNMLNDGNPEHQIKKPEQQHLLSYQAEVDYNSENDWYFPTRGSKFKAKFGYYTDNFLKLKGHSGTTEIQAMWRTSFGVSKHLSLQPMIYGRLIEGRATPLMLTNMIGGEWTGHYLEQQQPFAGVGNIEFEWDKFVAVQLQAQLALTQSSIILLRFAAAQDADFYTELLDNKTLLGASLSYYFNSLPGPIGASVGYSNVTKEPYFNINLGYVF